MGVTPLQAGVLVYLRQHVDARLTDTAASFCIEPATLVVVVQDLVRKGWITNHRSVEDRRAVKLKLSCKGPRLLYSFVLDSRVPAQLLPLIFISS